jgi:hypothetical protein
MAGMAERLQIIPIVQRSARIDGLDMIHLSRFIPMANFAYRIISQLLPSQIEPIFEIVEFVVICHFLTELTLFFIAGSLSLDLPQRFNPPLDGSKRYD